MTNNFPDCAQLRYNIAAVNVSLHKTSSIEYYYTQANVTHVADCVRLCAVQETVCSENNKNYFK